MAEGVLKTPFNLTGKHIWIAGHQGMVGKALCRRLEKESCKILSASRHKIDLRDQAAVRQWIASHQPDIIVICAAKVGGIGANAARPAEFFYDNIMISTNIIHSAHEVGVEKLLFLGSSCIYPGNSAQPITEESLLSGTLEPTNEAYALAKIGGVKMTQYYREQYGCDFISAMPCNLYGIGDSYNVQDSHVIPALIMKAHQAKKEGAASLEAWGSGKPLREFLYADDLAEALLFLLRHYSAPNHINVGSGQEITIQNLTSLICETVDYKGRITFDPSKPDGVPRKIVDSTKLLNMGWKPETSLKKGLSRCYADFLQRFEQDE